MRVKIILNPWSDRGRGYRHETALRTLSNRYKGVDLVTTERPGHAKTLARTAVEEGYDVVAAAGGDGTIHEVVNGLVRGGRAEAKLGIIPIGSGNDLAHALGVYADPETAVQRILHGHPRTIDLGRIEDDRGHFRHFDNNAGIGFDATVVIQTESMTRVHGFLMYLLATLHTIAFYYRAPYMQMRYDDEAVAQRVLFLAIGNGFRYGGGFHLTPDARMDDNRLDSCLVNPIGRLIMLGMLVKAIKGTHVTSKHVTMRRNKRITIRSEAPMPVHVDGEMFAYPQDNVRHVTFVSVPAALDVIV